MPKLRPPNRVAVTKRLKRAAGHLNATLAMIEASRPTLALAQQLSAVEAAVHAARRQVVHEQMRACLDGGDAERGTLHQLNELARFL